MSSVKPHDQSDSPPTQFQRPCGRPPLGFALGDAGTAQWYGGTACPCVVCGVQHACRALTRHSALHDVDVYVVCADDSTLCERETTGIFLATTTRSVEVAVSHDRLANAITPVPDAPAMRYVLAFASAA